MASKKKRWLPPKIRKFGSAEELASFAEGRLRSYQRERFQLLLDQIRKRLGPSSKQKFSNESKAK